ncbi:Transcriptional regulatory protein ZraR [Luteitalea pratensis]|uniref:Transcriptional regulatory protein ZraR n=2 Tax=Luteitalea pratensis TaxID=1855912 RepID=A0A143PXP1_LUTPR|nr:Transcriptional regulatory protein ZraR [Luteitalea pratensis]
MALLELRLILNVSEVSPNSELPRACACTPKRRVPRACALEAAALPSWSVLKACLHAEAGTPRFRRPPRRRVNILAPMSQPSRPLLLVDDEGAFRRGVAEYLSGTGFTVTEASTVAEALEQLEGFAFDVVLTDLRLPDGEGTTVLDAARARYPDILVLVVTGHGSIRAAVDAIRQGAADFVTKPFQLAELDLALGRAIERQRLQAENTYLREQLRERYRLAQLVGRSPAMQEVFKIVETVAPTNSTILILGETGTGKELVARAIHQISTRSGEKFVALNCSAIPESLLEAELFGHVKGAFTGAIASRPGRFELAHRGTLFLDEIGTMPVPLQAKLLRALQEREVERIGEARPIKIDVRVLAATNANLDEMVRQGTFREDLFYRLNVIPVQLPPLRERRDDVPLLVRDMLQRLGAQSVPPRIDVTFSQEAMRRLMAYDWPGNIRQLENTVERALALSPGRSQIDVSVLPPDVRGDRPDDRGVTINLPEQGLDLEQELASVERVYIAQALARTEQNRSRAADLLGVKRTTLVEKIKRLERLGLGDGLQ